jgi:hypothetical protein
LAPLYGHKGMVGCRHPPSHTRTATVTSCIAHENQAKKSKSTCTTRAGMVSQASLSEMTKMHDGYGLGAVRAGPPRDRGAWRRARRIRVLGGVPAGAWRRCRDAQQSRRRHQRGGRSSGRRRNFRLTGLGDQHLDRRRRPRARARARGPSRGVQRFDGSYASTSREARTRHNAGCHGPRGLARAQHAGPPLRPART